MQPQLSWAHSTSSNNNFGKVWNIIREVHDEHLARGRRGSCTFLMNGHHPPRSKCGLWWAFIGNKDLMSRIPCMRAVVSSANRINYYYPQLTLLDKFIVQKALFIVCSVCVVFPCVHFRLSTIPFSESGQVFTLFLYEGWRRLTWLWGP